jgi:hypothetical protein
MASLDTFRAELTAAQAAAAPITEGLSDYLSINLTPEARAKVLEVAQRYQQRAAAIAAVLAALEQLAATGYPASIGAQVEQVILDDLKAQQTTLTAALAQFTPAAPEAVSGEIALADVPVAKAKR